MNPRAKRFDEFHVGDEASFEVVLDEALVERFAALTGDRNPLHMSDAFAAQSMFERRIVHGMLMASHFSTLVGMYLPGTHAVYVGQDVRFLKPARIGDTVRVLGKVLAISAATRILTLQTRVVDARGEILVDGEGKVMVHDPPNAEELPMGPASLSLSGRVALITGASRGIGAATACLLAHHGATVVINYRQREDEARAIERQLVAAGRKAIVLAADVTDEQAVRRMFAQAEAQCGPVDILVNNASPPLRSAPFEGTPWTAFEQELAVVLGGAHHCIQAALPGMLAAKRGAIVNIVTSEVLGKPQTQIATYVAAKNALLGLTRALAVELGPKGIRVNAIAPGLTETARAAYLPQRFKDVAAHQTPLRRIGAPLDSARAVLFLVSDAADFLSGACLPVNGGMVMA